MTDPSAAPVASADAAARVLSRLEEAAWVLVGFDHLVRSGALSANSLRPETNEDRVAARMLAAVGLVAGDDQSELASGLIELLADGSLETRSQAMISTLRQVATAMGILDAHDAVGWAAQDDATLLAQGKSSALGGQMLAMYAIPSLEGLSERFATGGHFLDVGVGVAELAAAFCEALPNARVFGIDVLPRALDLAEQTIATRGLKDRLEVRLLPVQELADVARFDLAWMPAPFLPPEVLAAGIRRVHDALRPGGWLIIGAGRFDDNALAAAVTRWKTLLSGGTPLTPDEARSSFAEAGFAAMTELPTPPGAPALYAARKTTTSEAGDRVATNDE
jgi:SAM-dependent methyltransferase